MIFNVEFQICKLDNSQKLVIKLDLPKKPLKLIEKEKKLIKEFIDSDKNKVVWKYKYIYEPVRLSSHGKCCFSEIKLNTKSTYLEIEHFYPKDIYPTKVVEQGNLLPSSKKCNGTKGKTDTKITQLINPYFDNPKEHLYFEYFRLYPKNNSIKGQNTIRYTSLNDKTHFVEPRILQSFLFLDNLSNFFINFIQDGDLKNYEPAKQNEKINQLKGYLNAINRKTEFSACISTLVYDATDYKKIKTFLVANNLWDDLLQSYETEILFCYLGK